MAIVGIALLFIPALVSVALPTDETTFYPLITFF